MEIQTFGTQNQLSPKYHYHHKDQGVRKSKFTLLEFEYEDYFYICNPLWKEDWIITGLQNLNFSKSLINIYFKKKME